MKIESLQGRLIRVVGLLAMTAALAGWLSSTAQADASEVGSGSVTLSWSAPTENTNDSALTNLAGYVIYYGNSADTMTKIIKINTVGLQTYVVSNLSSGTWFFAVTAVNASGIESGLSQTVVKTL